MQLSGIKLKRISIEKKEGGINVSGSYDLISSKGTVLASQEFNIYQSMKIELSSNTQKAMIDFQESLKNDIETTLGFTKE